MSLPLHQVCLPPLRQTLQSLSNELSMASEHFAANGVDESAFLQARLAPDMFPFIQQIHAMTDHARRVVALLADIEMPEIAGDETDLAGLRKRIAVSLDFIESVDTAAIDAGEQRALPAGQTPGEPAEATALACSTWQAGNTRCASPSRISSFTRRPRTI